MMRVGIEDDGQELSFGRADSCEKNEQLRQDFFEDSPENLFSLKLIEYRKAAEQGSLEAQIQLAKALAEGRERYKKDALKWLKEAAEYDSNVQAQSALGCYYLNATGAEWDYEEAVKLLYKAAQQGDAIALSTLGSCYYNGTGVDQNYAKATQYFREAAELGNVEALYNLGLCYYEGNGVGQNDERMLECFSKAAEQGYDAAQYKLGNCYYEGRGVEQDDGKAAEWYRKAAEQGYAQAQDKLGNCYYEGRGVEQDDGEAVKWYRKAAEQGNAAAQCSLGICYSLGRGVEQDDQKGAAWYRIAADHKSPDPVACYKTAENYNSMLDPEWAASRNRWKAISNRKPVIKPFVAAMILIGDKIHGTKKKYKDFLNTETGKDMLRYYQKAAYLDHIGAKQKLRELKKYMDI